jgi:hypothetical protein
VRREDRICENTFPRVERDVSSATKPALLPHLTHANAPGLEAPARRSSKRYFLDQAAGFPSVQRRTIPIEREVP